MLPWNEIKPIKSYETDWQDTGKPALANLFDNLFGWVNESLEGRFTTLDAQREKMLEENPDLDIKNLNDGYQLEVDRLNAIQQQSSKGFQVVDINPGKLDPLAYPLTLPYEFIFDGTNFMPDANGSFVKNFRSVNIPIAGTFLKIEYIYENNGGGNFGYDQWPNPFPTIKPYKEIQYGQAFGDPIQGEADLITGQAAWTLDQFARTKVFIDFGTNSGKPHIVSQAGKVFKTYFNEVNITLNIGAPKIRVTIGFNSEVHESANASAINAKMALTGSARLLNDSDTVLSPFCLSDMNVPPTSPAPGGQFLATTATNQIYSEELLKNTSYSFSPGPPYETVSYGYNVMWISRIYLNLQVSTAGNTNYFRASLSVWNPLAPVVNGISQTKLVHTFLLKLTDTNTKEYIFEPSEPIRVVIPAGFALKLTFAYYGPTSVGQEGYIYSYSLDGYSYGEIQTTTFGGLRWTRISRALTDATFLSDFNRIEALRDRTSV